MKFTFRKVSYKNPTPNLIRYFLLVDGKIFKCSEEEYAKLEHGKWYIYTNNHDKVYYFSRSTNEATYTGNSLQEAKKHLVELYYHKYIENKTEHFPS